MIIKSYLNSAFTIAGFKDNFVTSGASGGPVSGWFKETIVEQKKKKNVNNSDFVSNLCLEKPQKDRRKYALNSCQIIFNILSSHSSLS